MVPRFLLHRSGCAAERFEADGGIAEQRAAAQVGQLLTGQLVQAATIRDSLATTANGNQYACPGIGGHDGSSLDLTLATDHSYLLTIGDLASAASRD